jgi:hypothetical protein
MDVQTYVIMELHAKPCIEIVILLRYSTYVSKSWDFLSRAVLAPEFSILRETGAS